jgi:hypothetical protein
MCFLLIPLFQVAFQVSHSTENLLFLGGPEGRFLMKQPLTPHLMFLTPLHICGAASHSLPLSPSSSILPHFAITATEFF